MNSQEESIRRMYLRNTDDDNLQLRSKSNIQVDTANVKQYVLKQNFLTRRSFGLFGAHRNSSPNTAQDKTFVDMCRTVQKIEAFSSNQIQLERQNRKQVTKLKNLVIYSPNEKLDTMQLEIDDTAKQFHTNTEQLLHNCDALLIIDFQSHKHHQGVQNLRDIVQTIKLLKLRIDKHLTKRTSEEQSVEAYIVATREMNRLRIALNSVKNEKLLKEEDDSDVDEEEQKIEELKEKMLQTKRDIERKRVAAFEVCNTSSQMLLKMINFTNSKKRKSSKARDEQRETFLSWLEWNVPCFFDRSVTKDYDTVDIAGVLAPDRVAQLKSSTNNMLVRAIPLRSLPSVQRDLECTFSLRHDLLMPITAVFVEDTLMYMEHPFVESGDLLHWLKRFDMNIPRMDALHDIDLVQRPTMRNQQEIRHVFKQINTTIGYLHNRSLILRQLKPRSIYVTDKGIVQVIHHGLWNESTALDRYTSPEVLAGGTHTQRSDIFTLGIMLYEALIGELEFDDEENIFVPDDVEVMNQVISPSALEVLREMLHSDPNRRPTAQQLTNYEYFSAGSAKDERILTSNQVVDDIRQSIKSYYNSEAKKGSPQLFPRSVSSTTELVPVVLEFFKDNVSKCGDLVKDLSVDWPLTNEPLSGAELYSTFFESLTESSFLQACGPYYIPIDDEDDTEDKTIGFMSLGKVIAACLMQGYSIPLQFPLWIYRFLLLDSTVNVDFSDQKQGDEELTSMVQRTMPFLATISKAALQIQDTNTLLRLFGLDIEESFTVSQLVKLHVDNQLFGEFRQRLQYLNAIKRGFWKIAPKSLIQSMMNDNPRVNTTEVMSLLLSDSTYLDCYTLNNLFECENPNIKESLLHVFEEMAPSELKRFATWTFGTVYFQAQDHMSVEVYVTAKTAAHTWMRLVELQSDSTKLQGVFKAHLIATIAGTAASSAPPQTQKESTKTPLIGYASSQPSKLDNTTPYVTYEKPPYTPDTSSKFIAVEPIPLVKQSMSVPKYIEPTTTVKAYCPACNTYVLDMDDHVRSKIHQQNVSGVKIDSPPQPVIHETPFHANKFAPTQPTFHAPKQTFMYDPNIHSNANMYYCHVCNMQLNGPEPYQLHLNGRKHKLAVERSNMSKEVTGDTSRPFFCELCEIQCTGPESYLAHLEGKSHKKMQNRQEIMKQISKSKDYETLIPSSLRKEPTLRCDICNVDCSSSLAYQQHVSGKVHMKNEEKKRLEEQIMARQNQQPQTNTSYFTTNWLGPSFENPIGGSTSLFSNPFAPQPQPRQAYGLEKPYQTEAIQRPTEPIAQHNDMYHCPICDLYLNSVESLVAHNEGKKHHKEVAKRNAMLLQQATYSKQQPVNLLSSTTDSRQESNFDEERAIQILEYFFKTVLRDSVTYEISSSGPVHMTKYMVEIEIPTLPPTISNNQVAPHRAQTIIGEGSSKALAKKDAAVKACELLEHWGILQQTVPRNLLYKPT